MTRSMLLAALLVAILATPSIAQLVAGKVTYAHEGTVLEGYLAYDGRFPGRRPGVLVVHQWKGLGDFEARQARRLARMGYVALCADVYGRGVRPMSTKDAAAVSGRYKSNRRLMRARATAALERLRGEARVDPRRIAAIGYCFGGTVVLELARSGADLAGVVSFHGGLATPRPGDARRVRAKVLVLHGAADPHVPPAEVAAFQKEMTDGGVDWHLVSYGGAVHAFTHPHAGRDPSKGAAYDPRAARRSWTAMGVFFDELFR